MRERAEIALGAFWIGAIADAAATTQTKAHASNYGAGRLSGRRGGEGARAWGLETLAFKLCERLMRRNSADEEFQLRDSAMPSALFPFSGSYACCAPCQSF